MFHFFIFVFIFFTIKILHLGQGSFTRKVRPIFTVKIIVSIFVKLFLILVLHLRMDNMKKPVAIPVIPVL
jgi:hypothetical protein